MTATPARASLWIFSRSIDLLVFVLPAAAALTVIAARSADPAASDSPEWVWLSGVLLVDVAHVWSTGFVTYLNPSELRRHPDRYWLVPVFGWVLGVVLYALGGAALFWRTLAYLAVFHFVRQQYGWMALYRAREGDRTRVGALVDGAAIYAATLYPLIWWHAHLPRRFDWFVSGDFFSGLPEWASALAGVGYGGCLGAYATRALCRARLAPVAWGKHWLLGATAATWYVGIVARNDDLSFTISNVLSHGIPYAALVFSYARHTGASEPGPGASVVRGSLGFGIARFVSCVWLLAYLEELVWDRGVWHERSYLFGQGSLFGHGADLRSLEAWVVPLLAVPQLTHYVLDGLFWRRATNANLRSWFMRPAPSQLGGQAPPRPSARSTASAST